MNAADRAPGDYPHKVLESTRLYIEELLQQVNELKQELSSSDLENCRLREQVRQLQRIADSQRTDQQQRNDEQRRIQTESENLAERFSEVERQNNDLANLYVASYQLHATVDREDVLQAIREIVINLIGSEEFGLYELDEGTLRLTTSTGARAESTPIEKVRELGLDRSLESGEVVVGDGEGAEDSLLACIPLCLGDRHLGDRVVGCIAIFELLGHKPALEQLDHELFDLLAAHAAPALYLAELHAAKRA